MTSGAMASSAKGDASCGGDAEGALISNMRPEFNLISSNPVRASIMHLFVKSKELNHTMQVEEISHRIGKRHSVIIYHLEQLAMWNIVKVVKSVRHGSSEKRSIWGLNMNLPGLVKEVYGHTLKFFFTQKELDKMCSVNRNARDSK